MAEIVPAPDSAEGAKRTSLTLAFFEASRVQAYGFALAMIYGVFLVTFYRAGVWIIDRTGAPVYTDFTDIWVVGLTTLHGGMARLYDSADFVKAQVALLGHREFFYPNWPYPPIFSLFAAPLGLLRYREAFLAWDGVTLLALAAVVYMIVRRSSAIAAVLASPFTAWNFLAGQNGFLTGALLGAGLYLLERRPVLAGICIGCLTYKPQFGILLPVALVAARQWRAFASAAVTAIALAGISAAAFGIAAWAMLPRALLAQQHVVLQADGQMLADWGRIQTIYGLARYLHGGKLLAWLVQGAATLGLVFVVWQVWRSPGRHALKAAAVSAAALIATPYAFSYDLAALAIPIAFLTRDQLHYGTSPGEQTILLALFGIAAAALFGFGDTPGHVTFGSVPLGPFIVVTLLALILRRPLWLRKQVDSPGSRSSHRNAGRSTR